MAESGAPGSELEKGETEMAESVAPGGEPEIKERQRWPSLELQEESLRSRERIGWWSLELQEK